MIFKKVFDAVHSALKKDVFDSFAIPEENKEEAEEKIEEIKLDLDTSLNEEVTMQDFEKERSLMSTTIIVGMIIKKELLFLLS